MKNDKNMSSIGIYRNEWKGKLIPSVCLPVVSSYSMQGITVENSQCHYGFRVYLLVVSQSVGNEGKQFIGTKITRNTSACVHVVSSAGFNVSFERTSHR